jgi:N-methylhydantoinase B
VTANPIQGGSGGSATNDGLSASDRPLAYLRSVPAEILEFEGPVIVHRFGLVPDSEGAGEHRGGFGVEFELEVTHPEALLVMRGKDRHRFSAWGAHGGHAGTVCTNFGRVPGEEDKYIGKVTVYRPQLGERVTLRGGGGGGYGDPRARDPRAVLADVEAGLVSVERAREVYGVAVVAGAVDEAETERLRSAPAAAAAETFDFGPGRTRWEAEHKEAWDGIGAWLWTLPAGLRSYAREQAWARLKADGEAPYDADAAAAVIAALDEFFRSRELV